MSLKLGKWFFKNSLGDFYYDEETEEVTLAVNLPNGGCVHEWRGSVSRFVDMHTEAIAKVVSQESIIKHRKRTV